MQAVVTSGAQHAHSMQRSAACAHAGCGVEARVRVPRRVVCADEGPSTAGSRRWGPAAAVRDGCAVVWCACWGCGTGAAAALDSAAALPLRLFLRLRRWGVGCMVGGGSALQCSRQPACWSRGMHVRSARQATRMYMRACVCLCCACMCTALGPGPCVGPAALCIRAVSSHGSLKVRAPRGSSRSRRKPAQGHSTAMPSFEP